MSNESRDGHGAPFREWLPGGAPFRRSGRTVAQCGRAQARPPRPPIDPDRENRPPKPEVPPVARPLAGRTPLSDITAAVDNFDNVSRNPVHRVTRDPVPAFFPNPVVPAALIDALPDVDQPAPAPAPVAAAAPPSSSRSEPDLKLTIDKVEDRQSQGRKMW